MIDIASLNSYVIYYMNINHKISRKYFLKRLGLDLVSNQISHRANSQYLSKTLRHEAADYLSIQSVPQKLDEVKK